MPSVVLFLDLLGTAGPHGEHEGLDLLRRTKRAVAEAREMSDTASWWRMTWFSDNLCLHYTPTGATVDTEALGRLLVDTGYLQVGFVRQGLVARGGIAFDDFYSDGEFVHGPALVRAVALEKGRAIYPRVVLDEAAIAIARRGLVDDYGGSPTAPWREQLLIDEQGTVFVDYLATLTDSEDYLDWRAVLREHRDLIAAALRRFDGHSGVEEKYRWLAAYHDDFLARTDGQLGDELVHAFQVQCSRPLGAFRPFGHDIQQIQERSVGDP